jgi:hypothetical protein
MTKFIKLLQSLDFSNITNKPLRVGYNAAETPQKLFDGLDVILDGFDLEYVSIPDFYPISRMNGTWSQIAGVNFKCFLFVNLKIKIKIFNEVNLLLSGHPFPRLGGLGALYTNRIDTLHRGFYVTSDRSQSFLFTNPLQYANLAAIYMQPDESKDGIRFYTLTANLYAEVYLTVFFVHSHAGKCKKSLLPTIFFYIF